MTDPEYPFPPSRLPMLRIPTNRDRVRLLINLTGCDGDTEETFDMPIGTILTVEHVVVQPGDQGLQFQCGGPRGSLSCFDRTDLVNGCNPFELVTDTEPEARPTPVYSVIGQVFFVDGIDLTVSAESEADARSIVERMFDDAPHGLSVHEVCFNSVDLVSEG